MDAPEPRTRSLVVQSRYGPPATVRLFFRVKLLAYLADTLLSRGDGPPRRWSGGSFTMLVLTRKLGENIRIGDSVKITVLEVRSGPGEARHRSAARGQGASRRDLCPHPGGKPTGQRWKPEGGATSPPAGERPEKERSSRRAARRSRRSGEHRDRRAVRNIDEGSRAGPRSVVPAPSGLPAAIDRLVPRTLRRVRAGPFSASSPASPSESLRPRRCPRVPGRRRCWRPATRSSHDTDRCRARVAPRCSHRRRRRLARARPVA